MSARANYVKIGVFVLVGVFLTFGVILLVGVGAMFQPSITMETYFDESVQGLDIGAPIKRRGVKIGRVEDIDFVRNQYRDVLVGEDSLRYGSLVVVTVSIQPSLIGLTEEEIRSGIGSVVDGGLRVQLATQGVTGIVHLEVLDMDPKENPLLKIVWEPNTLYIPSAPSKLTVLGTAISNIAKDLEKAQIHKVTQNLDTLVVGMSQILEDASIKTVSEQVTLTLSELRGTSEETSRLLKRPEILTFLHNAAEASTGAKLVVDDLAQTSRAIKTASQRLPPLVSRLNSTIHRMDRVLAQESQDLAEMIDNLRTMSETLREVAYHAKRNPSQVLWGDPPPPVEPRHQ